MFAMLHHICHDMFNIQMQKMNILRAVSYRHRGSHRVAVSYRVSQAAKVTDNLVFVYSFKQLEDCSELEFMVVANDIIEFKFVVRDKLPHRVKLPS